MTNAQLREARRLLRLTAIRLGVLCDLPDGVIEAYERTGRILRPNPESPQIDRLAVIRTTLEAAGVEFIPDNGGGPGVRLAKV